MTDYTDVGAYDENGCLIEDAPEYDLSRLRTGAWLDAQTFPPMVWAVHGLIPEGFGLFTGPPKAGKSWAALGVALAVAGGTRALGKIETGDPRPVLLLALEDGDRRMQGRCRHLLGEGVAIPELLTYTTVATPAEVIPLIREWLRHHGGQRPLVLLDTLGKVMPSKLMGENEYQRDYRIGSALKRLVDEYPGSCLMAVHHTRKAGSEDWMDSTSGTNGLNGSADFTVNLARARNEDAGILRVTGRDVPEGEYAITNRDGAWHLDGTALADAARKAQMARLTGGLGDRSAEIVTLIDKADAPVTPKQVEDALELPDARRYLARLVDAGRIGKAGRGLYTRVPSVPLSQPSTDQWDKGTDGTPPTKGQCTVCGFPLDASVVADGWTTHPACEESS